MFAMRFCSFLIEDFIDFCETVQLHVHSFESLLKDQVIYI